VLQEKIIDRLDRPVTRLMFAASLRPDPVHVGFPVFVKLVQLLRVVSMKKIHIDGLPDAIQSSYNPSARRERAQVRWIPPARSQRIHTENGRMT
jgi:hypothetical protein